MLSILVFIGADEKLRKAIEDEQEAYRLLDVLSENRRKELEKIIKEKDEQLEATAKELESTAQALEAERQKNEDMLLKLKQAGLL
jgi:16S rRNA A1518/A1519 N6-dimethyltransferase RsmA/KsgA/DIM1 with predicted DNA glycosylase/AP lyase activity